MSLCLLLFAFTFLPAFAQQGGSASAPNPLVEILKAKGILTPAEAAQINQAGTAQESNKRLADILLSKGLITQAEYDRLVGKTTPATTTTQVAAQAPTPVQKQVQKQAPKQAKQPSGFAISVGAQAPPNPTEPGAPSIVERKPSTTVNEALTPIRAFPVGGIKKGEMLPAFKAGGVGMTPYGFIKSTAVWDSSSPNGDDFPLPGFLTDTGPNGAPEFHIKARSTRFGSNFEWYDPNPKWTVTGKIEWDFEGNFNRSDNRNLSSIRSNNISLRLAWGRLDYRPSDKNVLSLVFGQDWTIFCSSTLPNMLETTGLGIDFGSCYERSPQFRLGYTHKMGGLAVMPEFAMVLPTSGLPPSAINISQQLGYGERQGPDSYRPQYQARLVFQWQLDHAKAVPPAQIIFSGFNGRRAGIVLASGVPAAYLTTFSKGVEPGSKQDGADVEWQLPTRWFTLTGKFYGGADLRWFFADQLYSFYNDTAGLTNLASAPTEDGASTVVFGTNASGQQVIAPERPVRDRGGFAQLGIPLSRIFNANPAGRNAGWSIYGLYGIDQAKTRDLDKLGAAGNRRYSTMAVGTLNYKFDSWVSFSFEQSLYTTHANPEEPLPLFRGVKSREWNDVREEMGPIFFF
ncbi:MAG: hypothetical protein ACP5EP_11070 [Acidobacteriaceae bacterium]